MCVCACVRACLPACVCVYVCACVRACVSIYNDGLILNLFLYFSASEPSNSGGVGGFKSAGQRFPFKSSGTQGKGSFGNYGFTGIKSTGGSIEYGDSNSQFKYGGTSLSMSENGWDEESDSGS